MIVKVCMYMCAAEIYPPDLHRPLLFLQRLAPVVKTETIIVENFPLGTTIRLAIVNNHRSCISINTIH